MRRQFGGVRALSLREGAGYAGGITSAAVDGMKCAEAVLAEMVKGEKRGTSKQ